MKTRKLKESSILLPIVLTLTLIGCGGGGGGGDNPPTNNNEETEGTDTDDASGDDTAQSSISANVWMTKECIPDSNNTYFKSLFEFKSDGQILSGYQDFQDTSCTTQAASQVLPVEAAGHFTVISSETLGDGTSGFKIEYSHQSTTTQAYFGITAQNQLCFSSNLVFQTGNVDPSGNPVANLDYEHCLDVHSAITDPTPNPDPNPDPNPTTDAPDLTGNWIMSNCLPRDDGAYVNVIYKFTADSRLLYSPLLYNNASCVGVAINSESVFLEFDNPITFQHLGSTTLSDGGDGYGMRLTAANETTDGYFVFDQQNRLCLSYNFGFSLADGGEDGTAIDYENCLVKYPD